MAVNDLTSITTTLLDKSAAPSVATLDAFLTTHESTTNWSEKFGAEARLNFVVAAVTCIKREKHTPDVLARLCSALRLVLRDQRALEDRDSDASFAQVRAQFDDKALLGLLIDAAHVRANSDANATAAAAAAAAPVSAPTDPNSAEFKLAVEACKCLSNIMTIAHEHAVPVVAAAWSPARDGGATLRRLMAPADASLAGRAMYAVAVLRLVLNIIADDDRRQALPAADRAEIGQAVLVVIRALQTAGFSSTKATETPRTLLDELEPLYADALKLAFSLTIHLGPLGKGGQTPPTAAETAYFEGFIPLLEDLLRWPADAGFNSLLVAAVQCMLNTPFVCTLLYQPYIVLPALLNVLTIQARSLAFADEDSDLQQQIGKQMTPTLAVLIAVARDIPAARTIIRQVVFPVMPPPLVEGEKPPMHPPREVIESGCVGGELLRLLTSFDMSVKYYATEFVYQLCDQSADVFISLLGFASAAGMLAMREMFGRTYGLTREGVMPSNEALAAARTGSQAPLLNESEPDRQTRLIELVGKSIADGTVKLVQMPPVAPAATAAAAAATGTATATDTTTAPESSAASAAAAPADSAPKK